MKNTPGADRHRNSGGNSRPPAGTIPRDDLGRLVSLRELRQLWAVFHTLTHHFIENPAEIVALNDIRENKDAVARMKEISFFEGPLRQTKERWGRQVLNTPWPHENP